MQSPHLMVSAVSEYESGPDGVLRCPCRFVQLREGGSTSAVFRTGGEEEREGGGGGGGSYLVKKGGNS